MCTMFTWDNGPISAFPAIEAARSAERQAAIAAAKRAEPTYWAQVAASGRTLATDIREDR